MKIFAQMQEPQYWINYEKVLGVKNNLRQYDFDVAVIASTNTTNVIWPGEQPRYTIQIINNLSGDIHEEGKIEIIKIGTKGLNNDIWLPVMYKIADIDSIKIQVNITANNFINLNLAPLIPEANGAYALILDLGKYGKRFITSVVRTFAADTANIQYPQQSLDDIGPEFLERLGIHAIRMGVDYVPTDFKESFERMEQLDKKLKEYQARHITVMLMFGEGPALMPLGTPRSFLDSNNTALKTKQDYVWLPSLDNDFKKYVEQLCTKYGWPAGPVTAVSLWNEPWEGISISGWQADMLRYREIYKKMAEGVLDARAKGADVLIGGTDSHSNAFDKLFPDGKMDFLPIFDFCSIHYEGMEAPSIYPQWSNRKSEKGRVKIWDTESWVGNTDDRIGTVIATNHAAGYDRCMGIYGGYLFSNNNPNEKQKVRNSKGETETLPTADAWPQTAALGAVQYMIGERKFKEILFKKGLPWVMLFNGNKNVEDGTAVICGDIGESFGAENVLHREVRSEYEINQKEIIRHLLQKLPPGTSQADSLLKELNRYYPMKDVWMTFKKQPYFKIYDLYGNEVKAADKTITIPLGSSCYYARTNGSKGSFLRLQNDIRQAIVTGYGPVEIIAKDLTDRIENKPTLQIAVTNILNRKIKAAAVVIQLGQLALSYPEKISLLPFETRVVKAKIISGQPIENNTYSLRVQIDAGKYGKAIHYEDMHVNLISRLTVKIDGKLDDWEGALPQTVKANGVNNTSTTEAAWYPFKNFSKKANGYASGYLAYDENNFYFADKVADITPSPGSYRFSQRNDNDFFYPDTSYKMDPNETWIVKEKDISANNDDQSALQQPDTNKRILNYWESGETTNSFAFELILPDERLTQIALYLPSTDVWKAIVEVYDNVTGNLLAEHTVNNLWSGVYVIFKAAGKVRIVIHSAGWWYTAKLGGIFLDDTNEKAIKTSAVYLAEDLNTKGNWKNIFGKAGYYIAGLHPKFQNNVTLNFLHREVKHTLIWPKGVRNFSYKKDPVLPDNSGLGFGWDNVLIAFNVIPIQKDELLPNPPGTMPRFTGYKDTDYEYALNPVAKKYGGGTEVWRLLVPGMSRKHFFPRQPKSPDEGAVKNAQLVIKRNGNTLITECAIPWEEIPDVKKALDNGQKIKFSFRVNDNGGTSMELAQGRSVSKINSRAFHPDWKVHWANEIEFGFEKLKLQKINRE
jgi:hypothetical protein